MLPAECCGGSAPAPDPGHGVSRRTVLRAAVTLPAAALLGTAALTRAANAAGPLLVHPRAAWAADLPPVGPLPEEAPGDVRFLLVHHTASTNDYGEGDTVGQLRSFFRYHIGAEKGWPDIAYNFLVDRYGGVWEGRSGSTQGPVIPSATGGTQGFAQLACFIGDHTEVAPTAEARTSMLRLLAVLADRYGVDTAPGATTTFVSRGSNRWARGESVTTGTIAGHRDMSLTTCPGETVYADLRRSYPAEVSALRAVPLRASPPSPTAPAAVANTATATPTATATASASPVTAPAESQVHATRAAPRPSTEVAAPAPAAPVDGSSPLVPALATGGAIVAAVATGAARHRRSSAPEHHPE